MSPEMVDDLLVIAGMAAILIVTIIIPSLILVTYFDRKDSHK